MCVVERERKRESLKERERESVCVVIERVCVAERVCVLERGSVCSRD